MHQTVFIPKKIISTPLIIENPVRSPMVPPIADSMSTNFAALSLVILSNVGVSKNILTYLSRVSHSYSINTISTDDFFGKNFVIQTLDCHRELNELFIIVIISKQFVHDILGLQ